MGIDTYKKFARHVYVCEITGSESIDIVFTAIGASLAANDIDDYMMKVNKSHHKE